MEDYYKILNLQPDAGSKDIKAAYEGALANLERGSQQNMQTYLLIEEAYKILSNRELRDEYDDLLIDDPLNFTDRDDAEGLKTELENSGKRQTRLNPHIGVYLLFLALSLIAGVMFQKKSNIKIWRIVKISDTPYRRSLVEISADTSHVKVKKCLSGYESDSDINMKR